jgi:beta-lactamase regulating signal transducer with metallopeptidase domain
MLWWIAETTLVAAALAAVAALAPRLRPLGPATRHALWLVVLVKLMVPPLLSWPWPLLAPPRPDRAPSASALAVEGVDRDREATESAAVETSRATGGVRLGSGFPARTRQVRPDAPTLRRFALVAWLAVSACLAAQQVMRIVRFRRRLRGAAPAPAWLVGEADRLGERLGVGSPETLVVTGLGSPLLWCLGRPKLLLPSHLVETLDAGRWRGILAHELAHLRRGDPWVRRLALLAGWVWWWNPLYWIARRRIDAEAELACDAWVVWVLPHDRVLYAATLLDITASLSTAMALPRTPAPTLGITSSGRFFERRLTMILRDHVPCRLTLPGLLGAGLLVLLALPSWTLAAKPVNRDRPVAVRDGDARTTVARGLEVAQVDDDDDDEEDKPAKPARSFEKEFEKAIEKEFGPGSEFEKAIEKEFGAGSEFEKEFGPGSEFEKAIKKELGPGSEFEAKMKELGERMEKKFGPGSDFAKRMKALAEEDRPAPEVKGKPTPRPKPKAAPRASARAGRSDRERRIRELESRIDRLKDELKKLKSDGDEDEDDDAPRP